uniref:Uncharacterized protein n=1 Tax=Salix viminalis TaxID=40686 RepID=A0A6N2NDU8_SALVM
MPNTCSGSGLHNRNRTAHSRNETRTKEDGKEIWLFRVLAFHHVEDKWIHAIPTAVLLCLFTLWWFSYPVNLEIKDGRIVGIHRADHDTPLTLDTRHVTLAASATSPIAPVPEDLTLSNEIEALPDSNESFRLYENGEEFVRTTYHADHEMPLSLNSNHVALTTTSAISPTAPVPQELRLKDQTEAHSMSNESFSA